MLSENERSRLIEALSHWAELAPDEPTLGFLDSESLLTPRELLLAVQENDSDGIGLLEILENGVRREGIDAVTRRIVRNV